MTIPMQDSTSVCSSGLRGAALVLALVFALTALAMQSAQAQTFKALHSFGAPNDGAEPVANLVFDSHGNLFGTTMEGGYNDCQGADGCGTVFELMPNANGTWSESVIHEFSNLPPYDGAFPEAPVVLDGNGNLYGTTAGAGLGMGSLGTAFELIPQRGGTWAEFTLLNFVDGPSGYSPVGGLILDASGRVFGTTARGGSNSDYCDDDGGCGAVFELIRLGVPPSEIVVHTFTGPPDRVEPLGSLILDSSSNLYGTTFSGGSGGDYALGTAYKLGPNAGGSGWTETILHSFTGPSNGGPDGALPYAGMVVDAAGNLYGTTLQGGTSGNGTVFELMPHPGGSWSESVLYSFQGGADGAQPYGGVTLDASGNLYGTTFGAQDNLGTVYKLTPSSGGHWTKTILHSFTGGEDGRYPQAGVILDSSGNLYGATFRGGAWDRGVAFEITP